MNEPPPDCVRLAAELCRLRDRCGLTLAALAEVTGYSKSSWQRYLSGKTLPPWLAVRALGVLAQAPQPRLQVLWDLAESAWRGRDIVGPAAGTAEPASPDGTGNGDLDAGPESARDAGAEQTRNRSRFTKSRIWLIACLSASCTTITAAAYQDTSVNPPAALAPGPADFHVACTGASCTGQDPQTTLCGVEPQTLLDRQTPQGAGIEIRYNPLCNAVWARTWNTQLGESLILTDAGGRAQSARISQSRDLDQYVYTPLLGLTGTVADSLKVCLNNAHGGVSECYSAQSP